MMNKVMPVERSIDAEATVNAPASAVWRLWTTTDGAKEFFAPDANIELRVDGPYEILFDLSALPFLNSMFARPIAK